jgi:hypothetical protein
MRPCRVAMPYSGTIPIQNIGLLPTSSLNAAKKILWYYKKQDVQCLIPASRLRVKLFFLLLLTETS